MTRVFNLNDVLIIDSRWMLRNDEHYLVLYLIETSEAKTWVLPPLLSYAVALINGGNTYSKLISYIGKIFGIDDFNRAKQVTDEILSHLEKNEVTIKSKSSDDCWNVFDSREFFIPIEEYRFPNRARLKLPTKVSLYTTKKCCADCVYCYADRRKDNSDELLSASDWKAIIDQCLSLGIWNIELIGGDQFASRQNMELIEYLMSKKVSVFLSTKCEITESVAEELVSYGFFDKPRGPPHKLQLSIDSVKPQVADFMSGTQEFLQRISRSVENCIQFNISPKIKTVLTPFNFKEIEDIVHFFAEKGVQEFQFVYYGFSYFKPREDLLLSEEHKKWIHESGTRIIQDYQNLHIVVQDEYGSKPMSYEEKMAAWRKRARCTGGFSSLTILPTGKVVLCEQIPQTERFLLGDIRKDGLMGVWQGEVIEKFLFPPKEVFKGTACEKCAEFNDCHFNAGFCYREALFAYDTMFEALPRCPYQTKKGRRLY